MAIINGYDNVSLDIYQVCLSYCELNLQLLAAHEYYLHQ